MVQISGRNEINWEDKFKLDVAYVNSYSFWFEAKILFRTITAVVSRIGVTFPGSPSMPPFKNLLDKND